MKSQDTPQHGQIPSAPVLLQRKCACGGPAGLSGECAECQKNHLQRKAANAGEQAEVPPIVHEVLGSSGQPLDAAARAFFEPRFGHDFSRVRVHTDVRAADSTHAVQADAYTVGQDIVFGEGKYAPESRAGRRLLVHELTHVAQQADGARGSGGPGMSIGPADSPAEREADTAADSMADSVRVVQQDSPPLVQRTPETQAAERKPEVIQDTATDQKRWQARVDEAVRARFGIKGTSLSKRVDFVDQAEFARRFPAGEMLEKLVTLFLDFGTDFNSIFYQILDHNNQSYQITGWSSFALPQLRAFVQKGIDQGFFTGQTRERDVTTGQRFPPFKITPRELLAQNIAGITNIAGERKQRSVLVQAPTFVHTLVHEACHFYIDSAFRNMAIGRSDADEILRGAFISQILTEGLAEYFARDVMEANRADFGPLAGQPYQREVKVVWDLVATLRDPSLRAAYFHGDKRQMRRLQKAIEEYKTLPEEWLLPAFVVDAQLEQEDKKKAVP